MYPLKQVELMSWNELAAECRRARQLIKALKGEVLQGLPEVDEVEISGSSDPQDRIYRQPSDEIREQVRCELFEVHAAWIQGRADELVRDEVQQEKWDAEEAAA